VLAVGETGDQPENHSQPGQPALGTPGKVDPGTKATVYSYTHPLFWAPFSLIGDGG